MSSRRSLGTGRKSLSRAQKRSKQREEIGDSAFGLRGRRTGYQPKRGALSDDDLESIDDFFDDGSEAADLSEDIGDAQDYYPAEVNNEPSMDEDIVEPVFSPPLAQQMVSPQRDEPLFESRTSFSPGGVAVDDSIMKEASPPKPKGKRSRKDKEEAKPKALAKSKQPPSHEDGIITGVLLEELAEGETDPESDVDENGVRRGTRRRIAPLAYWRNEKPIYSRRESQLLPVRTGVFIPDPTPIKKTAKRKSGKKSSSSSSGKNGRDVLASPSTMLASPLHPSERMPGGMGKFTALVGPGGRETEALALAVQGSSLQFAPIGGGVSHTGKGGGPVIRAAAGLGYANWFTSGLAEMEAGSQKEPQNTYDNTEIFFVVAGKVKVTLYDSNFVLDKGSMFFVPPHNTYALENVSKGPSKLNFVLLPSRE